MSPRTEKTQLTFKGEDLFAYSSFLTSVLISLWNNAWTLMKKFRTVRWLVSMSVHKWGLMGICSANFNNGSVDYDYNEKLVMNMVKHN